MNSIPINLAIEDELSEFVLKRLIIDARRGYAIGTTYGRSGYGYLRKTIGGWNRAAKGVPFIVLTDLDDTACAPSLIDAWLGPAKHPNLLFRVAVREVESWLLSDTQGCAKYLGCSVDKMPESPDALPDPKRVLVALASKSRFAHIRTRVSPRPGSTATQGPEYNSCLSEYVTNLWSVTDAARRSPSLARTVQRLSTFLPVWI
jgi:hypothetical protein